MRNLRCSLAPTIALAIAVAPAAAQPTPCETCARGDALIERFSLQPLRGLAAELGRLSLADPLTEAQYTQLVELRQREPALVRLGAVDDAELALVAAALCGSTDDACTVPMTRTLTCLADRCDLALPPPDPRVDFAELPEDCTRYRTRKRSPRLGLGLDWGTGWQRSGYPNDGRAWSFGISGRWRINQRLGAIARFDRSAGRDEATDLDGDGFDDGSTGSITRIVALAGPSAILHRARFERTTRVLRLDVLAGYIATRSQPGEDGPAAGFDLAYQVSGARAGVRVVQGLGGAADATLVLGHLGFLIGSMPELADDACTLETKAPATRLALGYELAFGGYGISSQLGYLPFGMGIEALWNLTPRFDALARADLLVFPGDERERVIHQAVLGGIRIDHARTDRRWRAGFFTTVMAGYTHGAGLTPSSVGSGPIADVSLGWGGQNRESAAYLRLHGRFGLSPDNVDYRVVFVSAGLELRFDRHRW